MIDLNRCMSATCMGGFGSFFQGERDREVSGHMVGEGERFGSVGTWECLCFSFNNFIIYSMAEQFYFSTFFGRAVTELLSVSGKYYTPITGKYIRS